MEEIFITEGELDYSYKCPANRSRRSKLHKTENEF